MPLPVRRKPARMTGWFDPGVLAQSASMLATANIFGRHSDTRLIEALGSQPQDSFDYSGEGTLEPASDFWLDYVADLGDGWNPTYAIADAISRESLHDTQAGRVLVMGGDQVYPYPSRDAYARRTESPYTAAFSQRDTKPDVFAIPGNHDWLDSLIAFSRLFCHPDRGFAGCRTRQTRSYFSVKLPRDWWLVGIDLQLGADLDEPQVQYFRRMSQQMSAQANVILCVPEPQWIYELAYPKYEAYAARTLEFFERDVLQRPVRVKISGDLHFYKRHADASGAQQIICGGGGAFLAASHIPALAQLRNGFVEQVAYPSTKISKALVWGNLLFPWLNPKAGWLFAVVYGLSAWIASSRLNFADIDTLRHALHNALTLAVRDPFLGLWLLFVVSSIMFFTDTHSRVYRVIGGGLHAIAHLLAALSLAWLSMLLTVNVLGMHYGNPVQLVAAGLLTFLSGGVVGGFVLGLYLIISMSVFSRHANEAYSALRIQDFKQWLRLRIDREGVLTGWCFAIDRVPRRWRDDASGRPQADDAHATQPRVVDQFSVRPRS
ncbi:MAG: hypothetical protein ABI616_05960 [Pseudomonadota bacterium]